MVRAVIIDDNHFDLILLQNLLAEIWPELKVCAVCGTVAESIAAIKTHAPQLVFLDTELRNSEKSFDLLDQFPNRDFEIIFVTMHGHHAKLACTYLPIAFLEKQVKKDDLITLMQRFTAQRNGLTPAQVIALMKENEMKVISIPTADGFATVALRNIIYLEAGGNCTILHINSDDKQIVVSLTLGEMEKKLGKTIFFRIHNSYTINCNHVKKYKRGSGGVVTMSNNKELDVSRKRKDDFLRRWERGLYL